MTYKTDSHVERNAPGFSTYCFVIRSCLEQDLHEDAEMIKSFMERHREELFNMYSVGIPAAAAMFALAGELELDESSW